MERRKCALVTGASRGLGRAFARECAARGMDLALVALPGSGLPGVAAEIKAAWRVEVEYLEADLTREGTVALIAGLLRGGGLRLDLLVNNAGIGEPGSFAGFPPAYHEDTIALNAAALARLCRFALGEFEGRSGCGILNVGSLGSLFPMPGMAVYSATKSFVRSFSLALREELAGRVEVSVLCPNAFATTPESAAYIARCGVVSRLACLGTDRIAREALDGLARGKAVIYPGRFNAFLAALSSVIPRSLVSLAVRRYWGGFAKEAPTLWSGAREGAS